VGLEGVDGVPEVVVAVVGGQDDLELAATAADADEVGAVAVGVQGRIPA